MSTDHLTFNYDGRLTGANIRLLTFKQRLENENFQRSCVRLEIIDAALPSKDLGIKNTCVQYLALSYVWGKSDDNNPEILINEKLFRVTPNLEKALIHLEHEVKLPIWIDAICINQKDLREREEQVAQMRNIYHCAVRTIIWLGEGDNSTGQVMTYLNKIGQEAIAAGLNNLGPEDLKQWPNLGLDGAKVQIRHGLEALFPKMSAGYEDRVSFPLRDLIDMSELPWFKRVWIIQELSLSSDYTFMCGKWTVSGDHFVAGFLFSLIWVGNEVRPLTQSVSVFTLPFQLFSMWWRNGWSFVKVFLGVFRGKRMTVNALAASTLGTRRKWKRDSPTLKQLLCHAFILSSTEGLDATSPRDRIYAFLGIASDATELNFPIDYKKTTTALYRDVARKLIRRDHLDILGLCRAPTSGNPRDVALPSWAPDWETRILPPWGGFIEDDLFHASGIEQPNWTPTESPESDNVLTIKALFVGKLKEIGTTCNSGWNEEFDHDKARALFTEVLGFLGRSSIFNQPGKRDNVFWRIPIGDKEMGALGMTQRATKISFEESRVMMAILTRKHNPYKTANMVSYLSAMKDMHNAKPFLSEDAFGGICWSLPA
jgi:hypothetical protein